MPFPKGSAREKLPPFPADLPPRCCCRKNIKHVCQTMQILLSAITKEFREKFLAFSRNCWFGGVVVQQQAVAAAIPNIRIFSRPISQRIQFSKYHLHTTLAAAKVISTFPVSCFSDDKIVDNAFVFSGPFYFNCPIGHVIQKLDMFVHKI